MQRKNQIKMIQPKRRINILQMNKRYLFILILLAAFRNAPAQSCLDFYPSVENIVWVNHLYSGAISTVKDYMKANNIDYPQVPHPLVYYKAVSHCCNNNFKKGIDHFDWILGNYNFSEQTLENINKLKNQCHSGNSSVNYVQLCSSQPNTSG